MKDIAKIVIAILLIIVAWKIIKGVFGLLLAVAAAGLLIWGGMKLLGGRLVQWLDGLSTGDSAGRKKTSHRSGHFVRWDVPRTLRTTAYLALISTRAPGSQEGSCSHGTHCVPSHQRCHVRPSRPRPNTSSRSAPHADAAGVEPGSSSPPSDSHWCQYVRSQ